MKLIIFCLLLAITVCAAPDLSKISEFEVKDMSLILTKEFFVDTHVPQIAAACDAQKLIISSRAAGSLSIDRLKQGAKGKPHSILEKSIKEQSIDTTVNTDKADWYDTLKGFVGHFDASKKLLGIRSDGINDSSVKVTEINSTQSYLPTAAAKTLLADTKKASLFYTGDYDLHEIYKYDSATNTGKLVDEGSQDKVTVLNALNAEIAKVDPKRVGSFEVAHGLVHIKPGGEYAMFQHGDQATYWENQENEAKAGEDTKLVSAVVNESVGENIAWYALGKWYITKGREQNLKMRTTFGLAEPKHWSATPLKKDDKGERNGKKYSVIAKKKLNKKMKLVK